jgi:NADPH-dependent 2,4-dienoyl-CoA reductase/sulfur reductase-like enzyme/nitrite reductase/ring-hydroxylating ferredoxin subunit
MGTSTKSDGPDLTQGIALSTLADGGMLVGRVGDDEVLVARTGDDVFAVGAHCTHYHGPLADGLIVGDTVRCPWHHACFSLRTGAPERAPALDPIDCWKVERQGDRIVVREKQPAAATPVVSAGAPSSVVIVGGGAAGLAAAEALRREGYDGPITMISADTAAPVDRPNLSKDYLAGTAKEDWIPLRGPEFYAEQRIDLLLGTRVTGIDAGAKKVTLDGGGDRPFGALLIATGADPVRLPVPGAADGQVYYLRSFDDSKRIIERAAQAKRVVVVGASFIGLEVAASLRTRGIDVDVVAPERVPLERVMGAEVGRFIQALHESKGVAFHLGQTVARVEGRRVTLSGGDTVEADFLVFGVGVRPATALADQAGLAQDKGILVNEYLETSVPGIFAAGDVARWPDARSGERIRVEHWVVAERQGQVAARNILGRRQKFDAVPFFWSQHYDVAINYVGHADRWDSVTVDGSLDANDATVTFVKAGKAVATATVYRDLESLKAEVAYERG